MLNSISKVIKVMIISDFLLNWGWGLLAPVFALFLTQNIAGGDFRKGAEIA